METPRRPIEDGNNKRHRMIPHMFVLKAKLSQEADDLALAGPVRNANV